MTNIAKALALTSEQQNRVVSIIKQAVEGFAAKGNPTSEDKEAFAAKILPNVVASIQKSSALNVSAKRADRLKTVDALAAAHGVKFVHRRDFVEEEINVELVNTSRKGYTEMVDVELVAATRGGETIAFRYFLDQNHNLSIDYSTAFCRSDENFDPLIGKEESLKKFLAGDTLNTPITHETFGQVKLTQLVKKYKGIETFVKANTATQ